MKVNAALSTIYAQGYDAQTVVSWARDYEAAGHPPRLAYQRALNDFIAGQPAFADSLGKITRLVDASDPQTVAKYDTALSAYIATGDDSEIAALGPMIARDSVVVAQKNGELPNGDITAASTEQALGFAMADQHITASGPQPAASQQAAAPAPSNVGLNSSQVSTTARVADKQVWNPAFDGSRLNAWSDGGTAHQSSTLAPHANAVPNGDA
ncbi:MAG: hypothetical protein JNL41_03200 [Phenylobacterium sp.]|nr:hypothetical protein [Phenylobacterium sp.]